MTLKERNDYVTRIRALERTLAAIAREPDCLFQTGRSSSSHDHAVICEKCYRSLKSELKAAFMELKKYRRKNG